MYEAVEDQGKETTNNDDAKCCTPWRVGGEGRQAGREAGREEGRKGGREGGRKGREKGEGEKKRGQELICDKMTAEIHVRRHSMS